MNNIEVAFFDLFFTLVKPAYAENEEENEYYDCNLRLFSPVMFES